MIYGMCTYIQGEPYNLFSFNSDDCACHACSLSLSDTQSYEAMDGHRKKRFQRSEEVYRWDEGYIGISG